MSIETWIIIGLVAGFLASKLVIRSGEGLLRDLGLGIGSQLRQATGQDHGVHSICDLKGTLKDVNNRMI